jgi:ABC-2 type transport system ATP-binding protein
MMEVMDEPFRQDDAVIRVEGLSKRYGKVLALDDVGFVVRRGTTTALLGANGAGKTTTLSILVGLLLPDAGRVAILGEDVLRHRYRVLGRMNYSSPYVDIPHRLTVMDNLRVFAGLYGIRKPRFRIAALAADLNLGELLRRPYGQLSSGQRTRVALAKALLNEPQVLLMDEPTASLDPDMADYVRSYLKGYQRRTGATLLMASHNMTEVERVADDVIMLREGRRVAQGPPRALLERFGRGTLEEVFIDIARGRSSGDGAPLPDQQGDARREAAP